MYFGVLCVFMLWESIEALLAVELHLFECLCECYLWLSVSSQRVAELLCCEWVYVGRTRLFMSVLSVCLSRLRGLSLSEGGVIVTIYPYRLTSVIRLSCPCVCLDCAFRMIGDALIKVWLVAASRVQPLSCFVGVCFLLCLHLSFSSLPSFSFPSFPLLITEYN